jgi:tripartite-type tricarboxylate transporter receptor subunit TctC
MADVPTMKEAGVDGVEVPVWYALLAPAATPREVVRILSQATVRAAHSPELSQKLVEQGTEPVGNSPEEFAAMLKSEVARWAEVVKISGARPE